MITVIGAPTSAGAYAPGQEDGPAALRAAGLLDALGPDVTDAGDIEPFRWRPDPASPRAANAAVVADRARQVAARVAAAEGRVLVLGGDCSVGVGTVGGLPGCGLVYFDRHGDLNVPGTTIDGTFDWMGVAHLLGVNGAHPEVAAVGELAPDRLAYLGLGSVADAEQAVIEALGLRAVPLARAIEDPEAAARAALGHLATDTIAVHFDVDVLDFLDAPLAENTDRAPGVPLDAATVALRTLLADPRVRALTVTEFNPHHGDPPVHARLARALAEALTA